MFPVFSASWSETVKASHVQLLITSQNKLATHFFLSSSKKTVYSVKMLSCIPIQIQAKSLQLVYLATLPQRLHFPAKLKAWPRVHNISINREPRGVAKRCSALRVMGRRIAYPPREKASLREAGNGQMGNACTDVTHGPTGCQVESRWKDVSSLTIFEGTVKTFDVTPKLSASNQNGILGVIYWHRVASVGQFWYEHTLTATVQT